MLTVKEIKEMVVPLVKDYPVRRVILFGSYARDEATESSDVDLAIDYEDNFNYWDFLGLIGDIIRKMPTKVDVLGLDEVKKPELLKNICSEGVIVYECAD